MPAEVGAEIEAGNAALAQRLQAFVSEVVVIPVEHKRLACRHDMPAVETGEADSRLGIRPVAAAAHHHGARLVIVDTVVAQLPAAFPADVRPNERASRHDARLRPLPAATIVMHDRGFEQVCTATAWARLEGMQPSGIATDAEMRAREVLAAQKLEGGEPFEPRAMWAG